MLTFKDNNNNNTNTNEGKTPKDELSFFPETEEKADGNNYQNRNPKLGVFTGVIKDIRPLQSPKKSTLFAVIDIEVEGETLPFQEFLHFNPKKANASVQYLVNICKTIAKSAGAEIDHEGLWNMKQVKEVLLELRDNKVPVHFIQQQNAKGQLDITYM